MPWLWAARCWIKRRGSGAGWVSSVWNVVTIGFRQAHKSHHPRCPTRRDKVQTRAASSRHRRGHRWPLRRPCGRHLDGRYQLRGPLVGRRSPAHVFFGSPRPKKLARAAARSTRVGGILGERCQPALFRRIGRNKQRSDGVHWSPPMVAAYAAASCDVVHRFETTFAFTILFHVFSARDQMTCVRTRTRRINATNPSPPLGK